MERFATLTSSRAQVAFFRGLTAFVPRVAVANSVQLATYDVLKTWICKSGKLTLQKTIGPEMTPRLDEKCFTTHFFASWLTSCCVIVAMQPFDFAATRMMNDERGIYKNPLDVLWQTFRGPEGVLGIYKGSLANYLRFGPYCILLFVFTEQLKLSLERL